MTLDIIIQEKLIINSKKLKDFSQVAYEALLAKLLTYKNPKFIENERYGYSNWETTKHLYSYEKVGNSLKINRGCLTKIVAHFKKYNIKVNLIDRTLVCESIEFKESNTILRPEQHELKNEMLKHDSGVVHAFCSFGKTVTLLEYVKDIGQPTLILVHTTFLQNQWIMKYQIRNCLT